MYSRILVFLLGYFIAFSFKLTAEVSAPIDWSGFLSQQDPVWEKIPESYFEGPFVGNGLLGTIIFLDQQDPPSLRFEIGRTDVYDHRPGPVAHYGARLPIGHLLLTPVGKILATNMRTNLWDAQITGKISTDKGWIKFRCFTPSDAEVILIQITTSKEELGTRFSLVPEQGNSSRFIAQPLRDKKLNYIPNPPFQTRQVEGMEVATQPLLAGSDYSTAWQEVSGEARTIFLSVANRATTTGSESDAIFNVKSAVSRGVADIEAKHRAWWHAYYPASFVSIPDARLQSFYWIQLYKMASATRENRPVVDLMGPWFKPSVWAAYWQNLNTQLAYYSVLPTNHPELGETLCRLLYTHQQDLINNVPEAYRLDSAALGNPTSVGNLVAPAPGPVRDKLGSGSYHFIALPWLMQEYYLQYRFTMDDERLRKEIFPLLKRTINTYLHVIDLGPDGRYHIPMAFSDEYGSAEDTNLNLALLRWGLQTLIACQDRLTLTDPDYPKWREVLARLVDYPTDETGLMIGKNTPFAKSHRHYSHLFAIFPLYILNIDDQPNLRPLMEKSIAHFLSFHGDNCIFKFTGAASLYAALGDGDKALEQIQRAIDPQPTGPTITPNTLYSENGWPTFESPISAQRAILDLLLQSWGTKIRIFPALPSTWKDVSFNNLRAEGAFLLSASLQKGTTGFVRIKSLAGEPCRIIVGSGEKMKVLDNSCKMIQSDTGVITLDLKKGQEAILVPVEAKSNSYLIAPVKTSDEVNPFGLKK